MRRLLARSQHSGSTFEADGPDFEAILDVLDNAGGDEADGGEKEVDVDEKDVEVESAAAGAAFGSEPDSEADFAED